MKAKLEKRLKKLEAKSLDLTEKGQNIQRQIQVLQQKYTDLMNQFVANEGAVREFKAVLEELKEPPKAKVIPIDPKPRKKIEV